MNPRREIHYNSIHNSGRSVNDNITHEGNGLQLLRFVETSRISFLSRNCKPVS